MSAITFDKNPAMWDADMQPRAELNLIPAFYNTTQEKLDKVFDYIHTQNWEKVPTFAEFHRKTTKLAHGIVYLGNRNFYIHLYRYLQDGAFKKVKFALAYNAEKEKARIDVKGCSHNIENTVAMCDRERDIALRYPFVFGRVFVVLRTEKKQAFYMQRFECELTDLITKRTLFNRRITVYDKLTIAIQLTQDLQIVHREGFFHGDVVPWNSLVKRELKKLKIIIGFTTHLHDFGLAFKKGEVETYLENGLGNISYLPPEIIRYGSISDTDPNKLNLKAWETWALGKIIQELLCPDLKIPWPDYPNNVKNTQKEKDSQKKQFLAYQLIAQLHKYEIPIPHDNNNLMEVLVTEMLAYNPEKRPPLENVLQKLVQFRDSLALPSCIRTAIVAQGSNVHKNLEPVIQCILRNAWEDIPPNTRFRRRDTSLPLGFIKLNDGKFYIHIRKCVGLTLAIAPKVGLIYEPAQESARLCYYESIRTPPLRTSIEAANVIASIATEGEKKRSILMEKNS